VSLLIWRRQIRGGGGSLNATPPGVRCGFLEERSYSTQFISSHLILSDLISFELSALWFAAATTDWIASQRTTQFAVAATNHSAQSLAVWCSGITKLLYVEPG